MSDDAEAEQRRKEREERRRLREQKAATTSAEADPKAAKKTGTTTAPPPVAAKAPAEDPAAQRREQRRKEMEERLKAEGGSKSEDKPDTKKKEEEEKKEAEAARKRKEEEAAAAAAAEEAAAAKKLQEEEEEAAAAAAAEEEEALRRQQEEEEAAAAAAAEEEAAEEAAAAAAAAAAAEEAKRREEEAEAAQSQRSRKESREEESNGKHQTEAPPAGDDDDYEARMAARAARRAQRQTVAITPSTSSKIDTVKSPPTTRKEITPTPAKKETPATKAPPVASKDTKPVQISSTTLMKQKEYEADDLAAIAEKKRQAVLDREAERKKALEGQGKSGEFKKSTSKDDLKEQGGDLDDLAAIAERKRQAVQEREAERKKALEAGKPGEFKKSTSKDDLKDVVPPPSAARSRFETGAATKTTPTKTEEPPKASWKTLSTAAKTVSAIQSTPVTRGKVNASMFEKPAETTSTKPSSVTSPTSSTAESDSTSGGATFGARKFGTRPTTVVATPGSTASKTASDFIQKETEKSAESPPRRSVFDKSFEQEKPKAQTVRATDLPSASRQLTGQSAEPPRRITVINKNPIVVGGFSASTAETPTLNSPIFMFTKEHNNVKEAVIDFINVKLGNDVQLKNLSCVPLSASNFATALKTGVLFCKLVNLVERSAVDERTINLKDLDNEKCIENFNLCINSARSAGCYIKDKPADLAAGNAKALEDVAYAIVKGYLRKRIQVDYESTRERCKMCNNSIDGQHGVKGNIRICTDCMEYTPLKMINFFTGENSMETNELKAKSDDPKKKAARQTMKF